MQDKTIPHLFNANSPAEIQGAVYLWIYGVVGMPKDNPISLLLGNTVTAVMMWGKFLIRMAPSLYPTMTLISKINIFTPSFPHPESDLVILIRAQVTGIMDL